ncbi:MAG: 2-C-methyl-D-erythritol 2,4-cyclodiphosphate synthase [Armatimonadetes bacterium]|nr:2-C-methyl-D-erythritol 2,4-cyclodiphosphate synthase [Armatimonadota bacterium]
MAEIRVGMGYDVHRTEAGRRMVLGGVVFEDAPYGLLGHSDGDVVLHAIADALLGAAGLGDIGQHFPDTDPRYAGADSRKILRTVADMVRQAGYEPVNIDVTLLAEEPRIGCRREAMRAAIADTTGIDPARVNIKATTSEGLGFVGRREGLACLAIAAVKNALFSGCPSSSPGRA